MALERPARFAPPSVRPNRMEAFSDGVFAIAATLLVLELSLEPAETPLEQLLHEWPGYLGYVVSFLTIGSAWLGHSVLTDRLTSADSILLRINLALLLVVAFLPFPTKLVSEGLRDPESLRVFITLYGLTLLAIRFLELAMSVHARRAGLHPPASDREGEVLEDSEVLPAIAAYVVAIVIGLFWPAVAVALYFGIAVFLVLPFREISRLLFRRP